MTARAEFIGQYLNVPVVLAGDAHVTIVKVDTVALTCAMFCSVPWPDEVLTSDTFGSAWEAWNA